MRAFGNRLLNAGHLARRSDSAVRSRGVLCTPHVRGFAGGAIPQHRDSKTNTANHSFDFTVENYERVNTILAKVSSAAYPLVCSHVLTDKLSKTSWCVVSFELQAVCLHPAVGFGAASKWQLFEPRCDEQSGGHHWCESYARV